MKDFFERVNISKVPSIMLIKAGAFDNLEKRPRKEIMIKYLYSNSDRKKRLTLQNFAMLIEEKIVPDELELQRKTFNFTKYIKKFCKKDDVYLLDDYCTTFCSENYEIELTYTEDGCTMNQKEWEKIYATIMNGAREWLKKNQDTLLTTLNDKLFIKNWQKYANGSVSAWEMEAMCFYYGEHELKHVDKELYGVVDFNALPAVPVIERSFMKGNATINLYELNKIVGTVIAKDKTRSTITLLTDGNVLDIRFRPEYFSLFDKQISELQESGVKKVMEKSWFKRGSKLMITGYRRDSEFVPKKYASTPGHQLYQITRVNKDGTLEFKDGRYGM